MTANQQKRGDIKTPKASWARVWLCLCWTKNTQRQRGEHTSWAAVSCVIWQRTFTQKVRAYACVDTVAQEPLIHPSRRTELSYKLWVLSVLKMGLQWASLHPWRHTGVWRGWQHRLRNSPERDHVSKSRSFTMDVKEKKRRGAELVWAGDFFAFIWFLFQRKAQCCEVSELCDLVPIYQRYLRTIKTQHIIFIQYIASLFSLAEEMWNTQMECYKDLQCEVHYCWTCVFGFWALLLDISEAFIGINFILKGKQPVKTLQMWSHLAF